MLEKELRDYILVQIVQEPNYIEKYISENAKEKFRLDKHMNEIIAECKVLMERNELKDENLKLLFKNILNY